MTNEVGMPVQDPYWEERGSRGFRYRGETFYTVTPVPFYYERRKVLLSLMEPVIRDSKARSICDFGCGDGYYLAHFSRLFPEVTWFGIDAAESMIERARQSCAGARFCVSRSGVPAGMRFDLVYSVAVFAHVMDDQTVAELMQTISAALEPGGLLMMFEQTGPAARGVTWCRRTSDSYVTLAEQCSLQAVDRRLIAFPVHRWFERTLANWYSRFLAPSSDSHERALRSNESRVFRAMSRVAVACDRRVIWPDDGTRSGNSFYVFRKRAQSHGPT